MRVSLAEWGKELREWGAGLRFGGYTLLLLLILLFGFLSVSHSLNVYVQQQQEIKAMRGSLAQAQASLEAQKQQLDNWQNQSYIKAQARNRLFYVMPGEQQFGIINDIPAPRLQTTETSAELTKANERWDKKLLISVLMAGLER